MLQPYQISQKKIGISVGSFYNYFPSKDILAKELIIYIADYLGSQIRVINESSSNTQEKISKIVNYLFSNSKRASRDDRLFFYVSIFQIEKFFKDEWSRHGVCLIFYNGDYDFF
jgi:TetR/AcrR family transcriptional regulator, repressor of fatR-cypB operon